MSSISMRIIKQADLSLYLIADAEYAGSRDLVALVREAVRGGVTAVQLRAKGVDIREFLDLAVRLKTALRGRSIPLIINDRVDIALACGAEGVHLGQDDMPAEAARRILGKTKIIGLSVNTMKEAREAERLSADYIGLGPVYTTTSKETDLPILGPAGISRFRARLEIPIIAIGGIRASNAAEVVRAGADGVAVISAVLGAADTRRAAQELERSIRMQEGECRSV
jgi:thiamine-phosphate pyrophosphorylase